MEYSTNDTYFASTLIALGTPLQDVQVMLEEPGGKPIVFFYFDNDGSIDNIKRRYELGNLRVNAKALAMAIKEQKKRVAQHLRELGR